MINNRNKIGKHLLFLLVALGVFLSPAGLFANPPEAIKKELLEKGKKVYFKRCVWCHGVNGDGAGPSAERLLTRPRNFLQGSFKIRTSDSGQLPFDSDLVLSVKNGLPGSAMPAWGEVLSEEEIQAVVQFVKSFVTGHNYGDKDDVVETQAFGNNPWKTSEGPIKGQNLFIGVPQSDIDKGKEMFTKAKCWECHGLEGRGDGNNTMKDDWGFPIVAANWHQCWNFRGSRRDPYNPANIARTISTGLNGTPMPSFKDQLPNVDDRWKLAAFINSLCPRKKIDRLTNKPINDSLISSQFTPGKIAQKIDDPMWQTLDDDPNLVERPKGFPGTLTKKAYIAMSGQISRGDRNFTPRVDNLWVSSRWSPEEKAVYYLVEYDLRFLSKEPAFPDGVGIQWPAKLQDLFGAEKPYFIYGDAKKPVDIWKATFLAKDYTVGKFVEKGYALDIKAEELNGNGYDKVEAKKTPVSVQIVDSLYKGGQVRVLFKRSLETPNKDTDVQIPTEKFIPVSFMEWSGINKEQKEHEAISTWVYTILEPPVPDSIYYIPPIVAVVFLGFEGWLVWMTKRTRKMYSEGKMN